jgi:hypothetical protein
VPLDDDGAKLSNAWMIKRLKHEELTGPNGEILKVSWMPGKRVRFDFVDCGKCALTIIWAKKKETHFEISYGNERPRE